MFGGAGPALGGLLGLAAGPGELMSAIDEDAMNRQVAARQASERWVQRQADMLSFGLAQDKKEGSTGRYNDTFRWKELSFKEKLQEETDEWLEKVLD